jgi:hypothetical protein
MSLATTMRHHLEGAVMWVLGQKMFVKKEETNG